MPILGEDDDTNPNADIFANPAGTLSPSAAPVQAVRTFLVGLSTDGGARLLAFRVSNLLIGRMPDNHLALNHASVSRRHAKLSVTPKGVEIEDMESQNGTTINGTPVRQPQIIKPGDVVRVGYVPLFFFGFVNPEDPPLMEVVDTSIVVNPNAPPV